MTADKKFKRLIRERARRTGESYATARQRLLHKHSEERVPMTEDLSTVTLSRVLLQRNGDNAGVPVLDLAEVDGDRHVYIFIEEAEARAIARALERVEVARPLTHDMLSRTVDAFGGSVSRIVLALHQTEKVYTADVTLVRVDDGEELHLDCRPSDAIALAVRRDPRPEILVDPSIFFVPPEGWTPEPPLGRSRI